MTNPKILCVDDETVNLTLLETLLAPRGYEVIKASNGKEALEKIVEQGADLVLLDVMMPEINGFEVCRRIKSHEKYRNIPVVFITALTSTEDRIKGIEAGGEDFISKPFDIEEVLARIKMLLKTKALGERRIGELLIDMEFITEKQLQEALKFARENNIKVGEALYTMGVLDKDRLYWVLGSQLNMNYVELSPEMIDKDLITQFPMDTLEQLLCLPLYETMWEINFAIADPTNQDIVKKVKSLRPEKKVQLNLALPDKIKDILNGFKGEAFLPSSPVQAVQQEGMEVRPLSATMEQIWNEFVNLLLSMPHGETYWLYKTPQKCRLLNQTGDELKTLQEYSKEVYTFIKDRLRIQLAHPSFQIRTRLFLQGKSPQQKGAFNVSLIDSLDREMIQLERISTFSQEDFRIAHPEASGVVEELLHLFREHPRLLIGGKERALIKQCCYAMCMTNDEIYEFPPPFFVEAEIEIYFPRVIQLTKHQFNIFNFLKHFKEKDIPFIFYETESTEMALPEVYKKMIVYLPSPSFEAMEQTFSGHRDFNSGGFKAVFFSPYQLQSI